MKRFLKRFFRWGAEKPDEDLREEIRERRRSERKAREEAKNQRHERLQQELDELLAEHGDDPEERPPSPVRRHRRRGNRDTIPRNPRVTQKRAVGKPQTVSDDDPTLRRPSTSRRLEGTVSSRGPELTPTDSPSESDWEEEGSSVRIVSPDFIKALRRGSSPSPDYWDDGDSSINYWDDGDSSITPAPM